MAGRIQCADINVRTFADAVVINVGTEKDPAKWYPYTQLNTRLRPIWSELWRHRASAADFFVSSQGFLHRQKCIEKSVRLAMAVLKIEDKEIDGLKPSEAVSYRIRAIMGHLRNAKKKQPQDPKLVPAVGCSYADDQLGSSAYEVGCS